MKTLRLKTKITLQFSILILVGLLIIGALLYTGMTRSVQNIAIDYIQETLKQTNSNLDQMLAEAEANSNNVIGNFHLQQLLNKSLANEQLSLEMRRQLYQIIDSGSMKSEYVNSVFIHSQDFGYYGHTDGQFSMKEIHASIINSQSHELYGHRMQWVALQNNLSNSPFIIGLREVPNYISSPSLGNYFVVFNGEKLNNDFRDMNFGEGGHVFLLGEDNQKIFGSTNFNEFNDDFFQELPVLQDDKSSGYAIENVHGVRSLITYSRSAQATWKTVVILPISSLTSEISYMKDIIIWAGIIALVLTFISAAILSGRITKPIVDIQQKMREVEKGNMDVYLNKTDVLEMDELSGSFNHMISELKRLINQVYKGKVRQREAELKALQAHINPHFLYNTLYSLYWMLIMKEQEEEAKLVLSLSDLFRYCTNHFEDEVLLETEFEQIKNYLKIQKVRYEDIQVDYYLDDRIKDAKVLKLLLQPLVENAIYHGLEEKNSNRMISVNAHQENDLISITIKDNGIGIPDNILKEVHEKLQHTKESESLDSRKGMGIENVYQRIKLVHGDKYGLTINSQVDIGTTIHIKLPIKKGKIFQVSGIKEEFE